MSEECVQLSMHESRCKWCGQNLVPNFYEGWRHESLEDFDQRVRGQSRERMD